ncbi:MAG: flagellar export protein FliJ [Spirochaetes bacterium]|nr:MAG: flagellar export protein FliJ [Spirochaetota bacterium]
MKKFKFTLEKLLDLRGAREKEIQNELAGVLSVQNRERMKQEQYRRAIREQHEKFSGRLKQGRFSYGESVMFQRYMEFAHMVVKDQQVKIERLEPEIQKVRERLIEAQKQRKVVERLKERKWQEYQYEYNREMAKEIDDMNQKLHIKSRLEEARQE